MYPRSVPAPIRCEVFAMRRVHMRHAQYAMHIAMHTRPKARHSSIDYRRRQRCPPPPARNLAGVARAPVRLADQTRLVYSPHVYGPGVYEQPYFCDAHFPANMGAIWDRHFGAVQVHVHGTATCMCMCMSMCMGPPLWRGAGAGAWDRHVHVHVYVHGIATLARSGARASPGLPPASD